MLATTDVGVDRLLKCVLLDGTQRAPDSMQAVAAGRGMVRCSGFNNIPIVDRAIAPDRITVIRSENAGLLTAIGWGCTRRSFWPGRWRSRPAC